MDKITQDMKYRQSLMSYAKKYGVAAASRKYNKCRSYIYFWLNRYDGNIESLGWQSRRPHGHPNAHTKDELKLIQNHHRRNPDIGLIDLWCRLRKRGYHRCPESLYRVMRRLELIPNNKEKRKYTPKPYEQMTRPGQRIQMDVKVVPLRCRAGDAPRLYQYTAIDECTRLRCLGAYDEQSTFSSADFALRVVSFFKRHDITVECIQTDNGFEFTNRFSSTKREKPTLFELSLSGLGIRHKLIRPYTPRHNGKVERSHREDQKRLYSRGSFYSLLDFRAQLSRHQYRSNNFPMRPLNWLSPIQFLDTLTVQDV
jgi:transposase InsO family protein